MQLELVRHVYLPEYTLGTLRTPNFELATIERPWIPHEDGPGGWIAKSCVPDGIYTIEPHDSVKFPGTYALINHELGVYHFEKPVGQSWGRTAILIHVANLVDDVVGCVGVGRSHGRIKGQRAVMSSQAAMEMLRSLLGRENHSIEIRATHGTEEQ